MNRRPSKNISVPPQNRKGQRRAASAPLNATPDGHSEPANGGKESQKLPAGWTWTTMGEIGHWFGGGTPSKANPRFWTGGSIPWVSPKDMKCDLIADAQDHITEDAVAQSATNLVEEGSILIVVRSGILQHTLPVAVAQRQVALNQDLKAIKPRKNIRADYLALALKAFERDILHTCTKTGTTVQSLELPVFLRFRIPVAPLPEQRRIVAEIEKQFTRLEAGVGALRRVQANLKRYRAAVLKAACEGKLVENEVRRQKSEGKNVETGEQLLQRILKQRREKVAAASRRSVASQDQRRAAAATFKYKEPSAPDTSDLPKLPEGWCWVTVEQTCLLDVGFAFKSAEFAAEGIRLLRGENMEPGRLRWLDVQYWPKSKLQGFEKYLINEGDIILAMDRPLITAGLKLAHAKAADLPCLLVQRMARFNVVEERMTAFLHIALQSHSFIRHLLGGQTGTQLPHVSGGGINSFVFAFPPLAEQARIVAEVERRLSVVEELATLVSANLQRATRLRQAILQKAFSGQL